jgi:hypothetical protein
MEAGSAGVHISADATLGGPLPIEAVPGVTQVDAFCVPKALLRVSYVACVGLFFAQLSDTFRKAEMCVPACCSALLSEQSTDLLHSGR